MDGIDRKKFAERMLTLRRGYTQEQFSQISGISRVSLARYETGERLPGAEELAKLMSAVVFDMRWLLQGEGPEPTLTVRENQLLNNYRAAAEEGKRALEATSSAVAKPEAVKTPRKRAA